VLATSLKQRGRDYRTGGERANFHTVSKKFSSIKRRVRGHVATLPKTVAMGVSRN
jgi:hypothetical protein